MKMLRSVNEWGAIYFKKEETEEKEKKEEEMLKLTTWLPEHQPLLRYSGHVYEYKSSHPAVSSHGNSHSVSPLEASSPAILTFPVGHVVHT
jgi:hypothetical protein